MMDNIYTVTQSGFHLW